MDIKEIIQQRYGETAETEMVKSRVVASQKVAAAFGYKKDELDSIPSEANMGLSCGNPLALASLKEGEVVLDLGSGGGLDCFLASPRVGPTGKVIGLDMTPSMIELARKNGRKFPNVSFILGYIENIPLESTSVDCVISNCVINLCQNKKKVFEEVFRVLKPGGRLAVSDICLKKELPQDVKNNVELLVGCIAGAVPVDCYWSTLRETGFSDIDIIDSHADLSAYLYMEPEEQQCSARGSCCAPSSALSSAAASSSSSSGCETKQSKNSTYKEWLKNANVNDYAASYKIFAIKP